LVNKNFQITGKYYINAGTANSILFYLRWLVESRSKPFWYAPQICSSPQRTTLIYFAPE